jgi:UDP-3-O-[3-hydroxymyristoyl] glucosamine N-acyltransferase
MSAVMDQRQIPQFACVAEDVRLGKRVRLAAYVNLYGCRIGEDTRLGAFVEVQRDATIGRRCKISSHTFVCPGVTVEDEVFIGPWRHLHLMIVIRARPAATVRFKPKTSGRWSAPSCGGELRSVAARS